ncbi:unnamed protein product [Discosporangium mesarthrocarpum]
MADHGSGVSVQDDPEEVAVDETEGDGTSPGNGDNQDIGSIGIRGRVWRGFTQARSRLQSSSSSANGFIPESVPSISPSSRTRRHTVPSTGTELLTGLDSRYPSPQRQVPRRKGTARERERARSSVSSGLTPSLDFENDQGDRRRSLTHSMSFHTSGRLEGKHVARQEVIRKHRPSRTVPSVKELLEAFDDEDIPPPGPRKPVIDTTNGDLHSSVATNGTPPPQLGSLFVPPVSSASGCDKRQPTESGRRVEEQAAGNHWDDSLEIPRLGSGASGFSASGVSQASGALPGATVAATNLVTAFRSSSPVLGAPNAPGSASPRFTGQRPLATVAMGGGTPKEHERGNLDDEIWGGAAVSSRPNRSPTTCAELSPAPAQGEGEGRDRYSASTEGNARDDGGRDNTHDEEHDGRDRGGGGALEAGGGVEREESGRSEGSHGSIITEGSFLSTGVAGRLRKQFSLSLNFSRVGDANSETLCQGEGSADWVEQVCLVCKFPLVCLLFPFSALYVLDA